MRAPPSESKKKSLRVAVVGGSIAGLCAGIALQRVGAVVDIFEKHEVLTEASGAGIVVQPELQQIFEPYAPTLPTTSCSKRRYLDPDGGDGESQRMPQQFTSWEAIYKTLMQIFPKESYHTGKKVEDFHQNGGKVKVALKGHEEPFIADLMVCAEGANSHLRKRIFPEVKEDYAGYVAWRGTVDEALTPSELKKFFDDTFTFSKARSGGHMLVYLIPGRDAETSPGKRRLNWVWYIKTSPKELEGLLIDKNGVQHHSSLPRGSTSLDTISDLVERANREVHPMMAQLVSLTDEPFLQSIVDVRMPQTVVDRIVFVGDASFVIRPHTAAATAKAAFDALALSNSLQQYDIIEDALRATEDLQMRFGNRMIDYGIALGKQWT